MRGISSSRPNSYYGYTDGNEDVDDDLSDDHGVRRGREGRGRWYVDEKKLE